MQLNVTGTLPRPAAVAGRAKVHELCASKNLAEALDTAREIEDPWYRCQALAYVAEIETCRERRNSILKEAFSVALEQNSANRVVTVSAWPLAVLCKFGELEIAKGEIERLKEIAKSESNPVCWVDSIFELLKKTNGTQAITKQLLPPFKEACAAAHGWRTDRNLRDAIAWVANFDRDEALELIELIHEPRVKRQAIKTVTGSKS